MTQHFLLFYYYDDVKYIETFPSRRKRDERMCQALDEYLRDGEYFINGEWYTRMQSLDVK